MASSLFLLLDDIAAVLDDVSMMTKVAAKNTAGVLGDDIALNAEQVSGVKASRELPVVWAVAKGSAVNKTILVPAALGISAMAPWAVTPILMIGGTYLCFEGAEKLLHKFLHSQERAAHEAELTAALADPSVDLVALERDKIKGAIRTDFILSAEIIVISLGTVAQEPFLMRLLVLSIIAAVMTVGVYGLVAAIVKMDDVGLALSRRSNRAVQALGRGLLAAAAPVMRFLSVAGTVAMFLVGGGIVVHGIPFLHHLEAAWFDAMAQPMAVIGSLAFSAVIGVALGAAVVGVVELARKIIKKPAVGLQ